jgi:integrase/recombinase XerD
MRRKIPVTLTIEEIQKILKIPNERTRTGLRNKAILSFIWDSGARVSDVINLKPGDLNIGEREATIIGGKGGVDRTITFTEYTGTLLKRYKDVRPKGKYFFCTEYQANNPKIRKKSIGNKLARIYLYSMIGKYAKRAGIKKKIGLHTLRHSFALNFYKSGHDLIALQKLLGHASLRTTEIYCYMDSTDVKEASDSYYKKRDSEERDISKKIQDLEKQIQDLKAGYQIIG